MVRFLAFAFATLILVVPVAASAHTTVTSGADPTSCAQAACASGSTPALAPSDGSSPGVTPSSSSDGSSSGGTPVSSSDGNPTASSIGEADASTADAPMSGDLPLANAAQEPEPDPEGPGREQPGEPGGEAQPPTGDDPLEVPGDEAPVTGGGLPRTGLEVLKLGLLGLVFLMVGARVRAIARRRRRSRRRLAADGLPDGSPTVNAVHPPAHREETQAAEAELEYERTRRERDVWSFPDPNEPAPTGLLPSTAMAKRRARAREGERVN